MERSTDLARILKGNFDLGTKGQWRRDLEKAGRCFSSLLVRQLGGIMDVFQIYAGLCCSPVSAGCPSRGGDVMVYVLYINKPSLPTPFYSVLMSVSVFMALSTVFHSINSLDDAPLSHSVFPV